MQRSARQICPDSSAKTDIGFFAVPARIFGDCREDQVSAVCSGGFDSQLPAVQELYFILLL